VLVDLMSKMHKVSVNVHDIHPVTI
jgi:hypothetical protein